MWVNHLSNTYQAIMSRAVKDEQLFNNLKRHPLYTSCIGNPELSQAQAFFQRIKTDPQIMDKLPQFKKMDEIGNPMRYSFEGILLSLNLIRYLDSIRLLKENFGSLDGLDIVEFGGGYGGLLHCICTMWTPSNYWVHDVPEVELVIDKHSRLLGHQPLFYETAIPVDLTISEYGITEQTDLLALTEPYLLKSKNVFLRSNVFDKQREEEWITLLRSQFNLTIHQEDPQIFSFNRIVIGRSE